MVALKKAYAEMILNTAKEAAARVMEAERRASRFQRDLCVTKEEAVRMLVKLKQMLDAKVVFACCFFQFELRGTFLFDPVRLFAFFFFCIVNRRFLGVFPGFRAVSGVDYSCLRGDVCLRLSGMNDLLESHFS